MYYINKIIGWGLSPLGILFLGLAGAWAIGNVSSKGANIMRTVSRVMVGATLLVFWFLSCGVTTRFIGVPLEGEEVEVGARLLGAEDGGIAAAGQARGVDAIVLLGGGMGAHEQCGRAEMFSGADRVWEAARVWKAATRQVPITISGGGAKTSTIPLLKDLGVPEEAILDFEEARNTEEEARMIYDHLRSTLYTQTSNLRKLRVILVTSAWHMPRAKMLFERAGFEVVEAPTDYEMHYIAEEPLSIKHFFPSAEALERNSAAVKEWVARIGYAVLRK